MARRHSRFVRPQPRTKMWIGDGVGVQNIAASATVLVGTLSAGALLLRPFTILRSYLEVHVQSDQSTAIEAFIASVGEIIVTDTATGIGVTAIPDPSGISGDPEADWFLWSSVMNSFFIDINGTDGIGVDGNNGMHYQLDSKAMRKVGPDDDLALMFSNETAVGLPLSTNGRRLIQLH